jgi:hypothetical protein
MSITERRQQCAYCGEDMGPWTRFSDRNDTCGKRECESFARDQDAAEREQAHRDLDEREGWI